MSTAAAPLRVILYEGAGCEPVADAPALVQELLEKGYSVSAARRGGTLSATGAGAVLVLGRFDGAPPNLTTDAAGDVQVQVRDLDAVPTRPVLSLVETVREETQRPSPGGWKPWFPVIDHARCTDCMQCLSFCLFGVYGVNPEGGGIQVQHESNCKTDCPACSRVCPEVAILFPKYTQGPINGAEVSDQDLQREHMKVDISALLGGDIYASLRERSANAQARFSKERDDQRALTERKRCLTKLKADMGIPDEVLASLPSLNEIKVKAEEARERARRALEGRPGADS